MNKPRIPWFGIVLIVLGATLLLNRLQIVHVKFSIVLWTLMMVVGFTKVGQGFTRESRARIFWGTVLFLTSLFFFLRSFDSITIHASMFLPASFLIVGFGMFMMYLSDLRDWFLLIASLLFCGAGVAFILADFDYLSFWDVREIVTHYWPVILIVIGLGIIFRRRSHPPQQTPTQ